MTGGRAMQAATDGRSFILLSIIWSKHFRMRRGVVGVIAPLAATSRTTIANNLAAKGEPVDGKRGKMGEEGGTNAAPPGFTEERRSQKICTTAVRQEMMMCPFFFVVSGMVPPHSSNDPIQS